MSLCRDNVCLIVIEVCIVLRELSIRDPFHALDADPEGEQEKTDEKGDNEGFLIHGMPQNRIGGKTRSPSTYSSGLRIATGVIVVATGVVIIVIVAWTNGGTTVEYTTTPGYF